MTIKSVLVTAALLVAVLRSTAPAPAAEDVVLQTTAPLRKPRKVSDRGGPADRVEVAVFIPADARPTRGAVMNPFNLKTVDQAHWQEACRAWGFALIGANYFGVGKDQLAGTLQAALDDFAAKANRPELKHVPLCFVGMSAGGGMSRDFALAMPARTIAAAPVCLEVAPDAEPLRSIPFLNVFGEKDGRQMQLHLEKLPIERSAGANWAIAVQWGRRHEFALANNLVVPFFEDVIRQRLPADADPTSGPVALRPAPQEEAWYGSVSGWSDKKRWGTMGRAGTLADESTACWLPSERVAATWRAFVASDSAVTISEPAGLGDKQPFTLYQSGRPIRVVAAGDLGNGVRVDLLDGHTTLAMKEAAPFVFDVTLEPGAHPLIIAVRRGDETSTFSRPHTIIVGR